MKGPALPNVSAILLPDPPLHNSEALPDDSYTAYTDCSNRLLGSRHRVLSLLRVGPRHLVG